MPTYGDIGDTALTATVDNTLTKITTVTMLPGGNWTIHKILLSLNKDTITDELGGSYVELKIDRVSGPFKYPCACGGIGATSGAPPVDPPIEIPVNISVPGNAKVEIHVLTQSAGQCCAGIVYS